MYDYMTAKQCGLKFFIIQLMFRDIWIDEA